MLKQQTIRNITWTPSNRYLLGELTPQWRGTALDILGRDAYDARDRIEIVTHPGWLDERTRRLFAVWCARQALAAVEQPPLKSWEACDVAERYADGAATLEELRAAERAAEQPERWVIPMPSAQAGAAAFFAACAEGGAEGLYAARSASWFAALAIATQAEFSAHAYRAGVYAYIAAKNAAYESQLDYLLCLLQEQQM